MIKTIKYTLLILLFSLAFSGCVGAGAKQISTGKKYSVISDVSCKNSDAKSDKTVKVLPPTVNRELDTNSILYSEEKYSLEGYVLSQWSDTPGSMLQKIIADRLDSSKLYENVVTTHIKSKSDYLLQSELWQFKQVFENGNSYGVLKIKMFLIDAKKRKLLSSKKFSYKIKSPSNDAYGAVVSLNKAVDMLINDLCDWLSKYKGL